MTGFHFSLQMLFGGSEGSDVSSASLVAFNYW